MSCEKCVLTIYEDRDENIELSTFAVKAFGIADAMAVTKVSMCMDGQNIRAFVVMYVGLVRFLQTPALLPALDVYLDGLIYLTEFESEEDAETTSKVLS